MLRWVIPKSSDTMWATAEGNGKPLQYSCLENPMKSMKRQNDRILKEEAHACPYTPDPAPRPGLSEPEDF